MTSLDFCVRDVQMCEHSPRFLTQATALLEREDFFISLDTD